MKTKMLFDFLFENYFTFLRTTIKKSNF